MIEWVKDPVSGMHRADGFVIEETGNPNDPFALYKTDKNPYRPSTAQYATCSGSLEDCKNTAEVLASEGDYTPLTEDE